MIPSDGGNRERACIKAGVEPRYRSIKVRNHEAAAAYVISKNISRRHLTPESRPDEVGPAIARAVKVDNKTVGAVRKKAREEIPHVSKRTDSKGRSQVAHKRNSAQRPPETTKSTIDLNDQCTAAVRETIEQTIEDLRRTGTTDFERLFIALVKVIEDIKRKTLPRGMRKRFV